MPEGAWAFLDALGRLAAATVLGGLLGLDREIHKQWAGLRTHALVALGAAVFVVAASAVPGKNETGTSRLMQGVAAGIGFIGAGTILKLTDLREVRGLTTAGSLWLAAAVGTAAGVGLYAQAAAGTLLALVVLAVLLHLEKLLKRANGARDPHGE